MFKKLLTLALMDILILWPITAFGFEETRFPHNDLPVVTHWSKAVDINNADNACAIIMAAFEDYNEGTDLAPYIYITGTATVGNEDLERMSYENDGDPGTADTPIDGPIDYCVAEAPTLGYVGGEPIFDGDTNNPGSGIIILEAFDLTYQCTQGSAPGRPVVVWMRGYSHFSGLTGGTVAHAPGMVFQGARMSANGNCDNGSDPRGQIHAANDTTFYGDSTSAIVMMISGFRRTQMRGNLTIACNTNDTDNLGIWLDQSWGVRMTGWYVDGCNTGLQTYGSVSSTYNEGYVTGSGNNLVYGDEAAGGELVTFDPGAGSCIGGGTRGTNCGADASAVATASINGLSFSDVIIEGGEVSNLVMFEGGKRLHFIQTHFETIGVPIGHSIIIGAGICVGGSRAGLPGASSGDCTGGGSLTIPTDNSETIVFEDLRFIGGTIGDTRGVDAWQGFILGEGAVDPDGRISLAAKLGSNDDGTDDFLIFADSAANVVIDLTGYKANTFGDPIGDYRYVYHSGERTPGFYADDLSITALDCALAGVNSYGEGAGGTASVASTCQDNDAFEPFASVGLPSWIAHQFIGSDTATDASVDCLVELYSAEEGSDGVTTDLNANFTVSAMTESAARREYIGALVTMATDHSGLYQRWESGGSGCDSMAITGHYQMIPAL